MRISLHPPHGEVLVLPESVSIDLSMCKLISGVTSIDTKGIKSGGSWFNGPVVQHGIGYNAFTVDGIPPDAICSLTVTHGKGEGSSISRKKIVSLRYSILDKLLSVEYSDGVETFRKDHGSSVVILLAKPQTTI